MPTRERRSCTSAGAGAATLSSESQSSAMALYFLAGAGFLPKAREGGAQQALNLGIAFLGQFSPIMARALGMTSSGAVA
jgi:hypothetical protein